MQQVASARKLRQPAKPDNNRSRPPFNCSGVKKIDPGIANEVRILWENGVETTESCQGGQGHPFPEPTVRFSGDKSEGPRALGIALQHGLRVTALRRVWTVADGEPVGPFWEMTFYHPNGGGLKSVQKANGTVTWRWR
jgi:hypothetical protein